MKSGRTMAATAAAMGWSLLAAIAVAGFTGCGGRKAGAEKTITLPGGVKMEMVWCPPGTFMMGSPEEEQGREDDNGLLNETQHRVKLTKGVWMAKYEVTQAQWEAVMGSTAQQKRDEAAKMWEKLGGGWPALQGEGADHPMPYISWDDAQEFCRKAGNGLRLPTEAQWEYACRAGSSEPYAGTGNLYAMGWYCSNSPDNPQPVGRKSPNAWGLHDMHGNVQEWCADGCGPYPRQSVVDPVQENDDDGRVVRGGTWKSRADGCRSAARNGMAPGARFNELGFRPCCPD